MNAFDSSGLNQNQLGGGVPVNLTGFTPAVTVAITWGGNFVFTDASAFPAGDSFGKINIEVVDNHGKSLFGAITAASGTATINTSTLNQTDHYFLKVTVTSTLGCIADGLVEVNSANTTATLGNYSISFTTTSF